MIFTQLGGIRLMYSDISRNKIGIFGLLGIGVEPPAMIMRYLNIIVIIIALQLVYGLIVTKKVIGDPIHISGVVHDHSSSNDSHISGAVLSDVKTPTIKTNVSGSKKMLSVQEPEAMQSQVIRKARSIGITLGSPEKPTSTQVRKKILRKQK